ncbi:Coenzyme F420 hydrogenase/dehydrogenase, beta subunit C-terminal domain [Paraclostridium dentum]|uniref:Coenzyme F420 hydrogenase/dehydrogenase, beta subunit C-terminal domain n=1 Tax=Paraclostridium dentum TaxID=2662455 RepID=UPI003AFFF109
MKNISDVQNSGFCCGCGGCSNIFKDITMEYDKQGNLRPSTTRGFYGLNSNIYEKICPAINTYELNKNSEGNNHEIWGEYYDLVMGYSTNKKIRHESSSGGGITGILAYLMETNKVDAVIHIGVSKTNPIKNELKISRNLNEIISNAGSRYSPSAPLEKIEEILLEEEKFAFVGKPCDIVALRNYTNLNEVAKRKIKYMISFFCAGTPSIKGTEQILQMHSVDKKNVKSFRYRGEGWPGDTKIVTNEGKEFKMSYDDSWGKILNRYLPKRCKLCPDGIGEAADIVCGDAWFGDENGYPVFEEKEGRSLIISRTLIGKSILKDSIKNGYINISEGLKIEQLKQIQPYQFSRKASLKYRLLAMKLCFKDTPDYDKSILNRAGVHISSKEKLKSFLGTFRRVIQGKL